MRIFFDDESLQALLASGLEASSTPKNPRFETLFIYTTCTFASPLRTAQFLSDPNEFQQS